MLRVFCEVDVKSFSSEFFPTFFYSRGEFQSGGRERVDVVGLKPFGKSLLRLETLQSTPPFLQLNFLLRLILGENWL